MSELNLSKSQLKDLKKMIEEDAHGFLQDADIAKDALDDLSVVAEDFGIKKAQFKSIAKAFYASSIDETTEKAIQFKQLYQEVLGEEGDIDDAN